MTARKLIVLTIDLPYPPNHGHKVDQYYRWKGFAEQDWDLHLICWRSPQDPPTDAVDVEKLGEVFSKIDVLPIAHDVRSLLRRLAHLPRYPSHVASRIPDRVTMGRLAAEASAFGPAAIILDGIYGGVVGETLARACGVPTLVRGHNVEFQYFAQQARAVTNVRSKLAWAIARFGLKRYEHATIGRAAWTFDVSYDDVAYWQSQGIKRISWSPTVFPGTGAGTLVPLADRRFDVAYIGNLRLPNNLAGLRWFVREVLPTLRLLRPGITLCFAGSNPGEEARSLFAEAPDITLVPDAPSADEILMNGRVLVNPILSGSGINVKSIDMLRYDAVIITTSIGTKGFAPSIKSQFVVRDDAAGFAAAIAEALAMPHRAADRDDARAPFGPAGLANQIALIKHVAGIARS